MRILVTGGAGFQGSHLVQSWAGSGHQVTVLNTYSRLAERNITSLAGQVTLVWGSVTDREIVEKTVRGHDVVVHLAAHINVDRSLATPRDFLDVNTYGTLNVLEAVRQSGARLIYASTCEVYGYAGSSLVAEDAELRPHSPYAAAKAAADRMCFAYIKSYGHDVTIMRPCNVYGERQKSGTGGAVVPIFAALATAGKPLTVFGTGTQRREYIHVKDLVRAYDLVLQSSDLSGATLNVGTGETPSVKEIADFIAERAGVSIINQPARPGEVARFALDSTLLRSLGFSPQIKFWDGLTGYLDSVLPRPGSPA